MISVNDRIIGIIGAIGSLFLFFTIKDTSFETKIFPVICLLLLFVLSIIIVLRSTHSSYEFKNIKKVILSVVLMISYVVCMNLIGFIWSSMLFLAAYLYLNKYEGKRLMGVLFSVLLPIALFGLFQLAFGVRLPEGIF